VSVGSRVSDGEGEGLQAPVATASSPTTKKPGVGAWRDVEDMRLSTGAVPREFHQPGGPK